MSNKKVLYIPNGMLQFSPEKSEKFCTFPENVYTAAVALILIAYVALLEHVAKS